MYALIYNNSSTRSPGCIVTNETVLIADTYRSFEAALIGFVHGDFFTSINENFDLGIDVSEFNQRNIKENWNDIVTTVERANTSQLQAVELTPVADSFFLMRWNKVQRTDEHSIRNSTSVHIAFVDAKASKSSAKKNSKARSPTRSKPKSATAAARSRSKSPTRRSRRLQDQQ